MKLDLYTRNLQTGAREQQSFESEEQALEFLHDRPKFIEVLGPANEDLPGEVNQRLRGAMRPLDQEELLLERQLRQATDDRLRERAQKLAQQDARAAAKLREQAADADPSRPMELRYRFDSGLSVASALDTRAISDAVRAAAMAWVAERNSWVEGRGQVVGEAKLTARVGPLPDGVSERVVAGTFIPVSAPAEDD